MMRTKTIQYWFVDETKTWISWDWDTQGIPSSNLSVYYGNRGPFIDYLPIIERVNSNSKLLNHQNLSQRTL